MILSNNKRGQLGVLGIVAVILVFDLFCIFMLSNIGQEVNQTEYQKEGFVVNIITGIGEIPLLSGFVAIINIMLIIAGIIILRGGS